MEAVQNLPVAQTRPRSQRWREVSKARWAYLFISPFFILFGLFGLYPMLFSVYLSFNDWKGVGAMRWVGLGNFQRLLGDTVFWQSLQNGFILLLMYVPVLIFTALALAVILNSGYVRGYRIFRTLIFLPFITNMVAAGFAFRILFTKNNGFANILLGLIGIPAVPWLESIWGARISLSLLIIWAWLGYNMVIMLAGLQTIPHDLTEAALVDGATRARLFCHHHPVDAARDSLLPDHLYYRQLWALCRGGGIDRRRTGQRDDHAVDPHFQHRFPQLAVRLCVGHGLCILCLDLPGHRTTGAFLWA